MAKCDFDCFNCKFNDCIVSSKTAIKPSNFDIKQREIKKERRIYLLRVEDYEKKWNMMTFNSGKYVPTNKPTTIVKSIYKYSNLEHMFY